MKEGFRRIAIVVLVAGCYLVAWRVIFVSLPSQKNTEDYVISGMLAAPALLLSVLIMGGLAAILCWIADGFEGEKPKKASQSFSGQSSEIDNASNALLAASMANMVTMTSVGAGQVHTTVPASVADCGSSIGTDCSSSSF